VFADSHTPAVFLSWIVMARFSAKTSSTDAFPRHSTRQRRRGPTRSSSTLSHHRFSAKARSTRVATLQRSCLTFIYVGNVSVHPTTSFFMCRLNFPISSVLMSITRTSKGYLGRAVQLRRLTSVAASVLGQCPGVLVNTRFMQRSYSPAWKRQQRRWL
jgi:hypothetical protein